MLNMKVQDGDYVTIGQELGVIEQYFGYEGTYEENGTIRASIAGQVQIHPQQKIIRVFNPHMKNIPPNKGDLVIGIITAIRKFSAGVAIYKILDKLKFSPEYGNVHVSKADQRYTDRLENAFVVGDIIRARIIGKNLNEYDLSTEYSTLGVIYAECSICGTPLMNQRRNQGMLSCEFCGNQERRKIASDFGNIQERVKLE